MSFLKEPIQKSNTTEFNRYPAIFSRVKKIAESLGSKRARVLSFGCSTGEEIESLDKLYLRNADLVGVDVNSKAIDTAKDKALSASNNCSFFHADQFDYSQAFDVVMALSVLCRWPDTKELQDISETYTFEQFANQLELLDSMLQPGGILILHNTNYYFEDTETFKKGYSIFDSGYRDIGFVTRFDVKGKRYHNARTGSVLFEKKK